MPRVTHEVHSRASIDDYHDDFAEIWRRDMQERSVFDLWLHVVDHASRVARAIRRQQPAAVIDDIADTTVWMMSFIAQCNRAVAPIDRVFAFSERPSDIIWMKYPGMCPSCFDYWYIGASKDSDDLRLSDNLDPQSPEVAALLTARAAQFVRAPYCECQIRIANFVNEKALIRRYRVLLDDLRCEYAALLAQDGRKVVGINEIQDMFKQIYCNVYASSSIDSVAFHLLEEIGEATQAIKDLYTFDSGHEPFTPRLQSVRRRRVHDEIADAFSWLFTLPLKIESALMSPAHQYLRTLAGGIVDGQSTTVDSTQLSMSAILWAKYGRTPSGAYWDHLRCPGCRAAPCECRRDLKVVWEEMDSQSTQVDSQYTEDVVALEVSSVQVDRDLVFISYSHHDEVWLQRLNTMLRPLTNAGIVSSWSDHVIQSGDLWRAEIQSALERTSVGILLVSDNFLASDFIAKNELPPLLEGARNDHVRILWIPISHCLYAQTPIAAYQAVGNPDLPLNGMNKPQWQAALKHACEEVLLARSGNSKA